MTNNIIILKSLDDINKISKFTKNNPPIYSLNNKVHKYLEKFNVEHIIGEELITEEDLNQIFDKTVNLYDWYNSLPAKEQLIFKNTNILNFLDTGEFHLFILNKLYDLCIISKIIKLEKPQIIISNSLIINLIKNFPNSDHFIYEEIEDAFLDNLQWNKIYIKFNIGKIPISFTISQSIYNKLKSMLENTICNILNFWADLNSNKEVILFLEINPSEYRDLLLKISKENKQIVFLNNRRSSVWNFSSINLLKMTKSKVLNLGKLLSKSEKDSLSIICSKYMKITQKIFSDPQTSEIFTFNGISFWNQIENELFLTIQNRMNFYIESVYGIEKYLNNINIKCVLSLNVVGETEKIVLSQLNKQIPSIMLEHAFANYTEKCSRYDILSMYSLFPDKIAVWGNIQKNYLKQIHNIHDDRIIICGSPRHDNFFHLPSKNILNRRKTILLCPRMIIDGSGHKSTKLHQQYEIYLKYFIKQIKSVNDLDFIVKLHPANEHHNEELKKIIHNIDPKIPIFQINSIKNLIIKSDLVICISPEGFDPSTVILESIILQKPVINVNLDNKFYNFSYEKDEAVILLDKDQNLMDSVMKILNDHEYKKIVIENGQKFLRSYLSNHGKASQYLANYIINLK